MILWPLVEYSNISEEKELLAELTHNAYAAENHYPRLLFQLSSQATIANVNKKINPSVHAPHLDFLSSVHVRE